MRSLVLFGLGVYATLVDWLLQTTLKYFFGGLHQQHLVIIFGCSIPQIAPEFQHQWPKMRQTLRRSCAACAKSKHSCDLRTPRCSRCIKRKVECHYANVPLTSAPAAPVGEVGASRTHLGSGTLINYGLGSLDPFHSYPQTRLPQKHVERLIHSCKYIFDRRRRSKLCLPIQFLTRSLSNTIPLT